MNRKEKIAELKRRLELYKKAEEDLILGKSTASSYTIGEESVTRETPKLSDVQKIIASIQTELDKLCSLGSGGCFVGLSPK
jgi:hypothetical protein